MVRSIVLLSFVFLALGNLPGCKSNPAESSDSAPQAANGIYVVNEGNFQRGNSSLTFYDPDSNKAYQNIFSIANGRDLGDTGNDLEIFGARAFVVVSGSQKIEVISTTDHKSVGTLQLPAQRTPYDLTILNDAKAYVTNLMDSSVTVFNPSTLQVIIDRIKVGGNPQGIAGTNGKVYVCNSGFGYDNSVSVLNAGTGALIKTVVVGDGPSAVGIGPNNEVVVKCDGKMDFNNSSNDTPGALAVIDADNDAVVTKVILPLSTYGHPGRMTISTKGFGYFAGKAGIIRFSFTSSKINVEGTPFSPLQAYGLAIDNVADRLYATDAKDYSQPGEVVIFDSKGMEYRRFTAGIIPGAIAFKR